MGVTYAKGSIVIDALRLNRVPDTTAKIMTGRSIIQTPVYVAIGMLEGTGFADAAVPAPIPIVGYMLLQAQGLKSIW